MTEKNTAWEIFGLNVYFVAKVGFVISSFTALICFNKLCTMMIDAYKGHSTESCCVQRQGLAPSDRSKLCTPGCPCECSLLQGILTSEVYSVTLCYISE